MSRSSPLRSTRFRLVIAAAVGLALAACDSPEDRVEKHLERGVALAERGDAVKARLEFRNALRIDGDHAPTRYEFGRLLEADGDLRAAFAQYRRAVESDPTHVPARVKVAQMLVMAGELAEAREEIDSAFALAPEDVEVLSTKAAVAFRLGDVDAALRLSEQVLARDPSNVGANMVQVSVLLERGAADDALAALDALIAADPTERAYAMVKLRLLAERDDVEGLERQLLRLTETFPDDLGFRQALVRLYVGLDDVAAAEAQMRTLAAMDAEMVGELVRFVRRTHGADAARAELEAQIATADAATAFEFELQLASLDMEEGRSEDARARLRGMADAHGATDLGDRARMALAGIALADGDEAAATDLVDTVLERDPTNVDALAVRAQILIDAYEPDEAIIVLRRALDVAPDDVRLMLLEARAHERSGNASLAGEKLAGATRASDFAPAIALRYAAFLAGRDQQTAAETVLSESARRNPGDTRVLSALADARLRLGDLVGVDEVAEMLRATEDGRALGDQVAATVLARQGRDEESVSLLERAVSEAGGREAALGSLIAGYVRTGQVARAEAFLDTLIEENPANVRALVLRAEVHLLQGEAAAAADVLEAAVSAAPRDSTGHLVLARFEIARGDPARAEDVLIAGLDVVDDPAALRLLLAGLMETRGAFDDAIEQYAALYESNPESIVVANNLASLLAEFREDDPEAIAFATRVAQRLRGTTVPHFLDTYAWVRFLTGDVDEALRNIMTAAEQLPDNPLVRYHAGRIFAAAGQIETARDHLEASILIDPDFPKAASAQAALANLPQSGG